MVDHQNVVVPLVQLALVSLEEQKPIHFTKTSMEILTETQKKV
jgi:hypothetical protein